MHPVSMTCRPVRLFAADNNIAMDEEFIDLMKDAHMQPPYSTINPNCLVPMLKDGDLKLTESSAILLADLSPYPNVERWIAAMKKLPNMEFYGLRDMLRGRAFVTLA